VITVNGKKLDIENMQLHDLLVRMELANQLCAVEVNKTLVPHKEREACELQDGDIVEIVTLVGGG
jgi:thiamine biosynthesis protein ThiS|tara:strand:+ start:2140 stop:2334 length:195 start_codon:yes stop_codon:yes gene_type:complete